MNLDLDPVFAQFNVSSPSIHVLCLVWMFCFYLTAHCGFIFPCCCCLKCTFHKRVAAGFASRSESCAHSTTVTQRFPAGIGKRCGAALELLGASTPFLAFPLLHHHHHHHMLFPYRTARVRSPCLCPCRPSPPVPRVVVIFFMFSNGVRGLNRGHRGADGCCLLLLLFLLLFAAPC